MSCKCSSNNTSLGLPPEDLEGIDLHDAHDERDIEERLEPVIDSLKSSGSSCGIECRDNFATSEEGCEHICYGEEHPRSVEYVFYC